MSIAQVRAVIEKVKPHVFAFDPNPGSGRLNYCAPANNSEMSTRYIIIDPILRSLGWDLSDPTQCVVDNVTTSGLPDYILLNHKGEHVIVIEAKRIQEDTRCKKHIDQAAGYANSIREARVMVLTNGQYWSIEYGRAGAETILEDGRKMPTLEGGGRALGIHWYDTEDNAQRLHDRLWKGHYWPS